MEARQHEWVPVPEVSREYRCTKCEASGYKKIYAGEYNPKYPKAKVGDILPHAEKRKYVQPTVNYGAGLRKNKP